MLVGMSLRVDVFSSQITPHVWFCGISLLKSTNNCTLYPSFIPLFYLSMLTMHQVAPTFPQNVFLDAGSDCHENVVQWNNRAASAFEQNAMGEADQALRVAFSIISQHQPLNQVPLPLLPPSLNGRSTDISVGPASVQEYDEGMTATSYLVRLQPKPSTNALVSTVLYNMAQIFQRKHSSEAAFRFVKSALNQDAAWFDTNNREELPTKMGTNIVYMSEAIGRAIADTFGLGVSALGCLTVALLLNLPLSLVMLAIIPVVVIIMLIFNYFIRKASKGANRELGMAGSVATEVIAGIKTALGFAFD